MNQADTNVEQVQDARTGGMTFRFTEEGLRFIEERKARGNDWATSLAYLFGGALWLIVDRWRYQRGERVRLTDEVIIHLNNLRGATSKGEIIKELAAFDVALGKLQDELLRNISGADRDRT